MGSLFLTDRHTSRYQPCVLALLGLFVISGCGTKYSSAPRPQNTTVRVPATLPAPPETLPTLPDTSTPQVIRPTTTTVPSDPVRSLPAALTLRGQASKAAAADNHSRAIGLLERAIRISPRDPLTFEALAQSHLALNQPGQALQLVRRGLSLNPTSKQRESLNLLAEKCQAML